MIVQFEEYKAKLSELKPKLEALHASLNIEGAKDELERLHAMAEAPGFWDNPEKSQQVVIRTKQLEAKCESY